MVVKEEWDCHNMAAPFFMYVLIKNNNLVIEQIILEILIP